jgi:hypothetical protein
MLRISIAPACARVTLGVAATLAVPSLAARQQTLTPFTYQWTQETPAASFPGTYNFPVFVVRNEMWALQAEGAWRSSDAKTWTRAPLPNSGLNSAFQKYVQLADGIYALGTMTGNVTSLRVTTRIARTRDLKQWEVVAPTSNLPLRVFYGAVVFQNKVWLLGGYDGRDYYNDVWNSVDALHWTRVTQHAAWSPRNADGVAVFRNRMWIIGGGVIDGEKPINPASTREVWSSADGVSWQKSADRSGAVWGGSPIVYDDRLWLIASNRNSTFAPSFLWTTDGMTWTEGEAPWAPRGAPAVWTFGGKLFMAGGKYSEVRNNRTEFIYRNDVWSMSRR